MLLGAKYFKNPLDISVEILTEMYSDIRSVSWHGSGHSALSRKKMTRRKTMASAWQCTESWAFRKMQKSLQKSRIQKNFLLHFCHCGIIFLFNLAESNMPKHKSKKSFWHIDLIVFLANVVKLSAISPPGIV